MSVRYARHLGHSLVSYLWNCGVPTSSSHLRRKRSSEWVLGQLEHKSLSTRFFLKPFISFRKNIFSEVENIFVGFLVIGF